MKIGLMVSGGLGLLTLRDLCADQNLIFVMTDRRSTDIIEYCSQKRLECYVGNPRNGQVSRFVEKKDIDVLISVNYQFLIEPELINLPKKHAFNLHGSLLPKYRGRTPHVWAIINGEKETGITAHLIDEGCDTGKIIEQIKIPIHRTDTGASILQKFNNEYPRLVRSVLRQIETETLNPIPQDNSKGTYYGKRTPEDGMINWDWSKERIYNWIRAQAPPYPGAFTFLNGKKITIRSSSFSDLGFHYKDKNGILLSTNPLTVKTCNGTLEIELLNSDDFSLMELNILLGK
ncbi:methionyl-tRNA formyltransferase [Flagellimonas marinaquae]